MRSSSENRPPDLWMRRDRLTPWRNASAPAASCQSTCPQRQPWPSTRSEHKRGRWPHDRRSPPPVSAVLAPHQESAQSKCDDAETLAADLDPDALALADVPRHFSGAHPKADSRRPRRRNSQDYFSRLGWPHGPSWIVRAHSSGKAVCSSSALPASPMGSRTIWPGRPKGRRLIGQRAAGVSPRSPGSTCSAKVARNRSWSCPGPWMTR